MDRLDELAVFVAILDAGSLNGAARQLRRSPPSVTRALAGLEARLGTRLIERTTRRLVPTESGRRFNADARRALAAYAEAIQPTAESAPRGLLRITAPLIFGRRHVTPVVASFLDAYPAIQAELSLADRYLDLLEEGLDIALRIGPAVETLPRPHRLGEVRRIVVASRDYIARQGEPRIPADLTRHVVVNVIGRSTTSSEWRFRAGRHERVAHLAPRLTLNEIEAALVAVRAGHGITRVLSYQVAEEIAAGTLVRLLRDYEPPPLPVTLVTASAEPPARVRVFLEYAVPLLSALPVVQPEE
jgi:DNA-binding transcriptional LysR family regulator